MANRDLDLEEGLRGLKLEKMAEIVRDRIATAVDQKWNPRRLLRDLIEEETSFRREKALRSRIRQANIPELWILETFPFDLQPGVDPVQIRELAELEFARAGINIVFIGPTGVGKTGLATSLLHKGLLNGLVGIKQKLPELLDDLFRSIADRRTKFLLNRLSKLDILLIDEIGYMTVTEDQANLFFKLMDNRYLRKKSTIITTNLGFDEWGSLLKNPSMTTALLSRLRQRCVIIEINGPDLRAPALASQIAARLKT